MYKLSRDKLRKSTTILSTIGILLIVTITGVPAMNSSALDFGIISKDTNVGSIDTKSLFNCFGAAITCDNDNTVNNNVSINNGSNGGSGNDRGTLTVSKQIACESTGGSPSDQAVCNYAINSVNYADPADFEMVIAASPGSNPSPDTFDGSSTGTPVAMGPGSYVINEVIRYEATNLENELSASITTEATDAIGDCTYRNEIANLADGTMTSGGNQECTIINTIVIVGATVPGAPEI